MAQGYQIITFEWISLIVTLGLVLLLIRLRVSQRTTTSLNLSDVFVFMAWLSFLIYTIFDTILYAYNNIPYNNTDPKHLILVVKIGYAQSILWMNCIYAAKAAMLAHYYNFIPRFMSKTRISLHLISVVVFIAWFSQLLASALWVLPVSRLWDSEAVPPDFTVWRAIWMLQNSCNVLTDILVYLLPIPTIFKLKLTREQVVGLSVLCSVGFISIVLATMIIVNMYVILDQTTSYVLAILEQLWTLLVVTFPVFKHVFYRKPKTEWQQLRFRKEKGTMQSTEIEVEAQRTE